MEQELPIASAVVLLISPSHHIYINFLCYIYGRGYIIQVYIIHEMKGDRDYVNGWGLGTGLRLLEESAGCL